MIEKRAFKNTLVRVGFNNLTAYKIIINGFNKVEVLGDVEEREIDKLVHYISRGGPSSIPLVDIGGNVIASTPM